MAIKGVVLLLAIGGLAGCASTPSPRAQSLAAQGATIFETHSEASRFQSKCWGVMSLQRAPGVLPPNFSVRFDADGVVQTVDITKNPKALDTAEQRAYEAAAVQAIMNPKCRIVLSNGVVIVRSMITNFDPKEVKIGN